MTFKEVYSYNTPLNEYEGKTPAQQDPRGPAKLLMPYKSTLSQPPPYKKGFSIVFNMEAQAWRYIEDHRQALDERGRIIESSGTPYWISEDNTDSRPRYVTDLGPLPEGALLEVPKNIEWLRAKKLAEITNIRNELEQSPIEVNGLVFDADPLSYQRIQAAYTAMKDLKYTIAWTLENNSIVDVNEATLKAVLDAVVERADTIFIRGRKLKDVILAETDYDKLLTIDWALEV